MMMTVPAFFQMHSRSGTQNDVSLFSQDEISVSGNQKHTLNVYTHRSNAAHLLCLVKHSLQLQPIQSKKYLRCHLQFVQFLKVIKLQ